MISKQESGRRAKAAALFDKIDALLVTKPENVRYLTGFTGSNGMLLLLRDGSATLFTDPRYTVQSKQQTDCEIVIAKGTLTKAVLKAFTKSGARNIGFEQDHLNVAQFEALKKGLTLGLELVGVSGLIENLRMAKDEGEIALIRASVIANSQALENALGRLEIGMTEAEFAAEIDYANRKLGAEGLAFDTIVAAGVRAALPHAHPGPAVIGPGMLLIDMGVFHNGYASDMTRMVHLGEPTEQYREAYAAVLEAQLAAIDAVKPGAGVVGVDKAAREVLKSHGFDKAFVHSTGHGLGLEIHENPRIGRKGKGKLETGMAITIEPGVYLEGWGGIRIEDTVLVTSTGCEILTPTSKALRVVS